METNQRKAGRPKASPRTGPLVLGEDYARTKVTLEIGERTAEVLADYTRWVEKSAGISANDARFKTVDFALREIFRRDAVWQAEKRAPSEPDKAAASVTPSPTPSPRPASATPPSLPPPTPRDPRASGDGNRL
jgi:hypothetical protein